MKKIIILIPVFNDWESLIKLLEEIDKHVSKIKNIKIDCFIINDSSTINQKKIIKPRNIESLKIMNMRENRGHARCNAFGIRYVIKNEKFDYLILMDGDGEDRPIEIKSLISEAIKYNNISIVAKRVKRSEGKFFQLLYQLHKIITFIFTGQIINFGNYCCLAKKDAEKICSKASLWSSFSGTIKKNITTLKEVNSIRGLRYFGPSQMSIFKLIIHSFSIIAVFKYIVLFRSILFFSILYMFEKYLGNLTYIFQLLLIIFNFSIFVVSARENKEELIKSHENLETIKDV